MQPGNEMRTILSQVTSYIPIEKFCHLFWLGLSLIRIIFLINKKWLLIFMSTISILCVGKFPTVIQTYRTNITWKE